jgi:outer membrane protein assembly factor BamB
MLAAALFSSLARGDDWPQWLGPKRDAVWRENGILEKFPEGGPKVRWRVPVNGGYCGPAVAGGRIFVMDFMVDEGVEFPKNPGATVKLAGKERVLCFNAADGEMIWRHVYPCEYHVQYAYGPRCTPTVKDGKVYTLGTEGHLWCIDAALGKPLWSHDFKKEYGAETQTWGHAAHPLLDGQKLICHVGGEGSAVVAFDKDTGKELWKALTAPGNAKNIGYCPPTICEIAGKRQLISWFGASINGLEPETGKALWSYPYQTYFSMAISTPRQLGDKLYFTSTFNHSLMLRVAADGTKAEEVWKGDTKTGFDAVYATPFVEGDLIYGNTSAGHLTCIKAENGERVWQNNKPNQDKKNINCADIFIVKNGDRFFLTTEQGDLIIAKLTEKGYEEIGRAHLLEPTSSAFGMRTVVWSHPAFANHCAYMRNDKELICVSLAANE